VALRSVTDVYNVPVVAPEPALVEQATPIVAPPPRRRHHQVHVTDRRDRTLQLLLRPHLRTMSIGVLAVLVEGAANLAEPWPLKIVLDDVLKAKASRGWLNGVILSLTGGDKYSILKLAAAAVLVIAGIGAICSYWEKLLATNIGHRVMHDLRRMVYSHIQRLSLAFHANKQTGDLVGCLTSDIDAIQTFVATGLLGVFVNAFTLLGMAVLMFSLNWRFTLVALSVAPLLFVVVFRYTRRIKAASRAVRKKEGEIMSLVQEVLSSMPLVKAFVREDQEQSRLEKESLESVEIAMQVRSLKVTLPPIVDMIVASGTGLVLLVGGSMALSGAISSGSLVLFIWYLGRMYKPMRELSKITDAYAKAATGYERIKELLTTGHEVRDLPGARPVSTLRGEIEFDRVGFSYQPGRPVLKQVSLRIQPGQVAALVGPTGAGKTTIVSLIARFYDPDEGAITIDGVDIRRFQQKSLRRQISFVLQGTLLFRAPVWYNIAYGKPEATRAEILRAAEIANAHEFIDRMPQGYDTTIGEHGDTLSGGQRQRIAIARAVLCDAPILILDEAATGLDAASEKLVFEALARLMAGKTSIVISHRLTTIRAANRIFVLDAGNLVEQGQHEELIRSGGLYARLHDLQSPLAETSHC
jgi:ATP-binding cassette, subfamily B, bacterial